MSSTPNADPSCGYRDAPPPCAPRHIRTASQRIGLVTLLACAAAFAFGACNSSRSTSPQYTVAARWLPASDAHFATVQRSTRVAAVPDPTRQVLMFERIDDDGPYRNAEVWVVSIDRTPPLRRPITIEGGSDAHATLLEYRREYDPSTRSRNGLIERHWGSVARRGHAVPAVGTITIESLDGGSVTAVVNLRADSGVQLPGETSPTERRLAGRYTVALSESAAIPTPDLHTRTSAPYRNEPKLAPKARDDGRYEDRY